MLIDVVKNYPSDVGVEPVAAATAFGDTVHSSFSGLMRSRAFPCIGAKSAWARNSYFLGLFGELGGETTTDALGQLLREFLDDRSKGWLRQDFSTCVAVFTEPLVTSESQFENLLWTQLGKLNAADTEPWSKETDHDPESSNFGFSYAGSSFFIVGGHPAASRLARKFTYPTITFNLHDQFERLRKLDQFDKFRDSIRSRDIKLSGDINPVLTDFGDSSEARQYSGRRVEDDWKCPFKPTEGQA